uniref:NADH dehydrogenase subunit 2 n=1 Tax=Piezodorus guildinii TaxID=437484 RepID=UPI002551CBEB|nr:NADH dehydrogenase subunit 2 [Piezodorus guildinii]WGT93128.1 NADH dehydrogenase subunit 2 [Piezodorus guildinii]
MKKSQWLFFFTLMLSTMITLSANNWISMWIGLEINMMSFIPVILNNNNNKSSSEAAMIYFITQSISSLMLFMMVLLNIYNYLMNKEIMNYIITLSILIKLGAAPFHSWMPKIMSMMNWQKCIILMTWQKIAPLMMMSNLNTNMIINMSIIWSIIIGSLGGINQTSLRKMMGYSSINHLGWMLAIIKNINLWMSYLIIYSMLITMICLMMNKYNIFFINQMNMINMKNTEKISFLIMMMSMGGLPPFIGFLPKWITIQSMINNQEYIMIMIMIMFSLIILMYYLRIMTSMFMYYSMSNKWYINYNSKMTFLSIMINFSLPLIMMIDII